MKRLLLVLLMCGPAWAANDFTGDPNCIAWWRYEVADWNTPTDAVIYDHSGKTNHIEFSIARTDSNTVTYREGAASVEITSTVFLGLYLEEPDMSSDFPVKAGTSNNVFSAVGWFYPKVLDDSYHFLVSGYSTSSDRCWGIVLVEDGPSHYAELFIGYNNGDSFDAYRVPTLTFSTDRWYHIGGTYDGSDDSYRLRVYDEDADTVYETSGTASNTMNIEASDGPFFVTGNRSNGSAGIKSLIDEVVILNDILTADEIDEIRLGTYGSAAATGTSNWWWRRRHN